MESLHPDVDRLLLSQEEIADIFTETGFSRLPVYRENVDNIVGIIYQKDFYNQIYHTERQLEEIIRGSVRVLVEQMPYVTLLLRLRGNSPVELEALARRRRITRVVEGLVAQGQEDGELRQDVSGKSAPRLMLGMVNSIVDWYQPGGSGTVEDLADTAVAMVFSGLRS